MNTLLQCGHIVQLFYSNWYAVKVQHCIVVFYVHVCLLFIKSPEKFRNYVFSLPLTENVEAKEFQLLPA